MMPWCGLSLSLLKLASRYFPPQADESTSPSRGLDEMRLLDSSTTTEALRKLYKREGLGTSGGVHCRALARYRFPQGELFLCNYPKLF